MQFVIVPIPSLTMKYDEEDDGEEEEMVRRKRWRDKEIENIDYIEPRIKIICV